ncbi:hypothetical protein THAOC_05187 [Thalassiosira oceanica]|uniref:Uncharacterized protein n=1 Tax=Thalassiosira oceanica TaxID=159749 RepID=K0T6E5_THAOC|nr:hypothetical protein THAOC_05187 [Thalassiosira oceanica]|eukprot:EJK73200.1 hypothetical protein THAOC_05187 [Thalassiosira oceanica]
MEVNGSSRRVTKLLGEDGEIVKPHGGDALTVKTALNAIGYSVSLVTSYLAGLAGWFSGGTPHSELATAYQTLITPTLTLVSYAWGVIFLLEGFFVISQLFRSYQEDPLVRGIGYKYFSACLMQAMWGVTFGFEKMVFASIAMSVLLFFLLWIVKEQWYIVDEQRRMVEQSSMGHAIEKEEATRTANESASRHPLLRLPFSIHAAWIMVSAPWMICVALVAIDVDAKYEMWVSALCEALIFAAEGPRINADQLKSHDRAFETNSAPAAAQSSHRRDNSPHRQYGAKYAEPKQNVHDQSVIELDGVNVGVGLAISVVAVATFSNVAPPPARRRRCPWSSVLHRGRPPSASAILGWVALPVSSHYVPVPSQILSKVATNGETKRTEQGAPCVSGLSVASPPLVGWEEWKGVPTRRSLVQSKEWLARKK